VIDYNREDFTKNETKYDCILDIAGNRHLREYRRALKPGGVCTIIGFTRLGLLFEHMIRGPISSRFSRRKVTLMGTAQPNKEDLLEIKTLIEAGKVRPVIEKRFPMSEAAAAVRHVDEGHAGGKVVIVMGS
jgi:NADPH:quinone reductase-like Zn-dependent oxidoreductase